MVSSVRQLKESVKNTLPQFLKVLHTKGKPTIWLPQEKAIEFERVKLHQNDRCFLIVDYDVKYGNPYVEHCHYDVEPNFISYNIVNGSHQAYWFLADPVHCQDGSKHRKSHQYLKAIESAYDEKYDGDNHFARYISRNPFFIGTDTDWRHNERYKLKDLASVVQLNQHRIKHGDKAVPLNQYGKESRNTSVFDELRLWAYKQDTKGFSFSEWQQRCVTQAVEYNLFENPMCINEINSIARSVAQYTFNKYFSQSFSDYVAKTHTSEIQAIRGRKRAEQRWKGHVKQEPWIELNISKATYYRRLKTGVRL